MSKTTRSRLGGMWDDPPAEEPTAPEPAALESPAAVASPARRERQPRTPEKAPARREAPAPRERRPRELGKRSHPDYRQVALFMRTDTHFAAVDRLRHEREFADFGELVEGLVSRWLAKGKK